MRRLVPIALALALAFPAAAQVRFHVTSIGTLGGAGSRALAIADDGTVVGQSQLGSGGTVYRVSGDKRIHITFGAVSGAGRDKISRNTLI